MLGSSCWGARTGVRENGSIVSFSAHFGRRTLILRWGDAILFLFLILVFIQTEMNLRQRGKPLSIHRLHCHDHSQLTGTLDTYSN